MAGSYDDAVSALYQAPRDHFVAERKRLAAELRTSGDKAGAARLAKLARPTITAWAVNQLWWRAREPFEELLALAARMRAGDLAATAAHREAIAKLRARAALVLASAGHPATEASLRRITTTLSALAAAGGFQPDLPGALAEDREAPGFEAMAMFGAGSNDAPAGDPRELGRARTARGEEQHSEQEHGADEPRQVVSERGIQEERRKAEAGRARLEQERRIQEERRKAEAERARVEQERRKAEAERARVEQERRTAEAERARSQEERRRLEAELRSTQAAVNSRVRDVERLRSQLVDAEQTLDRARTRVQELEARLAGLARAD